jgi:predicted alpha/beta hydrolase family esterase
MKVNIPGLHNSKKDHWQTYFELQQPSQFIRIEQENWDEPDCETWINKIEKDLEGLHHSRLILIGHSIGCMAIVKWFEKFGHTIKGALFVAPTDAEKENFPSYISGFSPIPRQSLPFPSILVASTNDHVTSLKQAQEFALNWGSVLHTIENAGHLEPKSGFGEWPAGFKLVEKLEHF